MRPEPEEWGCDGTGPHPTRRPEDGAALRVCERAAAQGSRGWPARRVADLQPASLDISTPNCCLRPRSLVTDVTEDPGGFRGEADARRPRFVRHCIVEKT